MLPPHHHTLVSAELAELGAELESLGGGVATRGSGGDGGSGGGQAAPVAVARLEVAAVCLRCAKGGGSYDGIVHEGDGGDLEGTSVAVYDPRVREGTPVAEARRVFGVDATALCADVRANAAALQRAVALPAVRWLLDGFSVAILAQGESGTGKTRALLDGRDSVLHSALRELFVRVEGRPAVKRGEAGGGTDAGEQDQMPPAMLVNGDAEVALSAWSVLGNEVCDLLLTPAVDSPGSSASGVGGASVWGGRRRFRAVRARSLTEAEELVALVQERVRASDVPRHVFVRVTVCGATAGDGTGLVAVMHVVDTVGSRPLRLRANDAHGAGEPSEARAAVERARRTVASDLLALGRVVSELSVRCSRARDCSRRKGARDSGPLHAARDAVLTEMVTPLLAGNCKSYLLACVSDAPEDYLGTVSTLRVAARARAVRSACMRVAGDAQRTLMEDVTSVLDVRAAERAGVIPERGARSEVPLNQGGAAVVAAARPDDVGASPRHEHARMEAAPAPDPPVPVSAGETSPGQVEQGEADVELERDSPTIQSGQQQQRQQQQRRRRRRRQSGSSSSVDALDGELEAMWASLGSKSGPLAKTASAVESSKATPGELPEDVLRMLQPRRGAQSPGARREDDCKVGVAQESGGASTREALEMELVRLKGEFRDLYSDGGKKVLKAQQQALLSPHEYSQEGEQRDMEEEGVPPEAPRTDAPAPTRATASTPTITAQTLRQAHAKMLPPCRDQTPATEPATGPAPAPVPATEPAHAPGHSKVPPPTSARAYAPTASGAVGSTTDIEAPSGVPKVEASALLRSNAAVLAVARDERARREAAEARAEEAELELEEVRAAAEAHLADERLSVSKLRARLRRFEAASSHASLFDMYEDEVCRLSKDAAQARAEAAATSLKLAMVQVGGGRDSSGEGPGAALDSHLHRVPANGSAGGDGSASGRGSSSTSPLLAPRSLRRLLAESASLRDENAALRRRERRWEATRAASEEQRRRLRTALDSGAKTRRQLEDARLQNAALTARLAEALAALDQSEAANAEHVGRAVRAGGGRGQMLPWRGAATPEASEVRELRSRSPSRSCSR